MNREKRTDNRWLDGVMGVITGDALGCPVQFLTKEEIAERYGTVSSMIGYGTYRKPEGTWTDDGSMTLATMISIQEKGGVDLEDMMGRFADWLMNGEYTPFGEAFDNGAGTTEAIIRFMEGQDVDSCGGRDSHSNGNGSLMRILPACLYCYEQQKDGGLTDREALELIHRVSGLTHNHMRAKIACGLYYFMIRRILDSEGDLTGRLQEGLDDGFGFYGGNIETLAELAYYFRLRDLSEFKDVPESEMRSGGYVVESLEAAVWSLIRTGSFRDALITAVNMGHDTDTVGAICGGLAGLYYGYGEIPEDWLAAIQMREWIENVCSGEGCERNDR